MTPPDLPPRRPRWPVIVAVTVPPVVLGTLVIAAMVVNDSGTEDGGDLWVGSTDYGPTSEAPAAAVQSTHDALHDIGTQCLTPEPDGRAIASDVDVIIAFAQRYPVGRFVIDDETATATSLLVVTQQATKDCAPENTSRIEAQLALLE